MSGIGVATGDGVLLHSCASCGRHAWSARGRELDRDELIELLRDDASAAAAPSAAPVVLPDSAPVVRTRRPRSVPVTAATATPTTAADDRRSELQDLLRGFTVHGGSS